MLSQLSLQMLDGPGLSFSVAASSFDHTGDVSEGCATHIFLAQKVMAQTFGKESPRSLVLARGMPYNESADAAFVLAERAGVSPARIVSLGNQCSAIIDGLAIAVGFAGSGLSPVALIAADQFSELVDGSEGPAHSEWRNMAGCFRIESGGRARLRSIASLSDPALVSMATLVKGVLKIDQRVVAAFRQVDVEAQVMTIEALMDIADNRLGRPFLCVTNRSVDRLSALAKRLEGRVHLVESRKLHGHTGGADILLNLAEALKQTGSGGANIICSANGLGYIWSSALITVDPARG